MVSQTKCLHLCSEIVPQEGDIFFFQSQLKTKIIEAMEWVILLKMDTDRHKIFWPLVRFYFLT